MIKDEIKSNFGVDKPDVAEEKLTPLHNQARIEWDFKSDEVGSLINECLQRFFQAFNRWMTGCDSIWGEGFSKVSLTRTEQNTGLFTGYIDSRIIKSGKRIERAGWASMKTIDRRSFNRKHYNYYFKDYSHLLIKCRGDGRSYKVILHNPGYIDLLWHDAHSFPLHTHGGPYWQYARLPFSRFFHTVGGRIQDRQYRVPDWNVRWDFVNSYNSTLFFSNISIVMMDRIDGKFQLEIDYIGVVNDQTHKERFAYEEYNLPIYNPNML
jgi:NADH dehydrogenase [ubiquinone] 1 alpha subcomplex assembly factor 1